MKVVRVSSHLVQPQRSPPYPPPLPPPSLVPLSTCDLSMPPVHVQVLYAYQAPSPPTELLQSSLAKVLNYFRHWAGRLCEDADGRLAVRLNDEGALLVNAEADAALEELMPFDPSPQLLELIPVSRGVPELLLVQLTRFACGGLVLGVAWYHRVADAFAASEFMDAWSRIAKGDPLAFSPTFDRSILMARNPPQPVFDHIEYRTLAPKPDAETRKDYPDLATRKFHFGIELLKKIKGRAAQDAAENQSYTTFESLVAHLWRCITRARGLEEEEMETRAIVAVNGRRRLKPSIPREYFGNVVCLACPQATTKEVLEQPLSFVAGLVHKAIKRLDDDYIRSAIDFFELHWEKPVPRARVRRPNLTVTSWAQMGLFELDFGSGTPLFAGSVWNPGEGFVILAPSYTRDGSIDAVIGLFEPEVAKLEEICFEL